MIAYKATYNFKCRNQTYKVGKTYTSDRMKMCEHGFHFCQKMEDVLGYYSPNNDFILLEIEVLGKIETRGDKSVTDKFRVLRVIPQEEYTEYMKKQFPIRKYNERGNVIFESTIFSEVTFQYDERNNKISETSTTYGTITYKYDKRNNLISEESVSYKVKHTYDERNNRITTEWDNGDTVTFKYDERNNKISKNSTSYGTIKYKYDKRNNLISETYPSGRRYEYAYDDRGNRISEKYPSGDVLTRTFDKNNNVIGEGFGNEIIAHEVANITEED